MKYQQRRRLLCAAVLFIMLIFITCWEAENTKFGYFKVGIKQEIPSILPFDVKK